MMLIMQPSTPLITQDLVFIGGGHSHAIALKRLGMKPLTGVRLTLITDVYHTPYSGMLPGYVAGFYDLDQCQIDLRPLAGFAQAHFIYDRAIGLDLQHRQVLCAHHPPIPFDTLSIDIGSTPNIGTIPGAQEYAIPVKPISQFLQYWHQLIADIQYHPDRPLHIGVVGGGAGGVELVLNMQARLRQIVPSASVLEFHLFHRGQALLEERSPWIRQRLLKILSDRGIQVHLGQVVAGVTADHVTCQSGLTVKCDRLFWVTQATAAPWLSEAGLAVDARGFIQVNHYLQSISHPYVFAAGDIATLVNHPRPKAGVFAVRAGKPLVANLQRFLDQRPLKLFIPQREFLILIGLGDRTAVASRGSFGIGPHPLLWRWKDHIDRVFMDQFTHLKPMGMAEYPSPSAGVARVGSLPNLSPYPPFPLSPQSSLMRCGGCGSKVSRSVLEKTLNRLQKEFWNQGQRDDLILGLEAADDGAVISVPPGKLMVQTVDYFRSLVNDPFLFGQIVANHCLSDLFAMGATPQSALAIATLPYGLESKTEDMLYQLLAGATTVLQQAQALLVGGHTSEGAELAFGLTCNGLVSPDRLLRKNGMQPGQALILTKPLGIGILFAADMRLRAKGRWLEAAIASMLHSNQEAITCLQQYGVTACTDVTGFGLLGHLLEMVLASQVAVELDLESLPLLAGVNEMIQNQIFSSLYPTNLSSARWIEGLDGVSDRPLFPILFDPQTAGGLLATVPEHLASTCLTSLQAKGYQQSRIMGRVVPSSANLQPIRIKK
jgi:selenide,water dikinase